MSLPIPTKPPTRTRKPLPRPIFLDNEDQDVDNHPLHCSICFDVSFNPVITPCQHIFCRDCIESGLRRSMSCPIDRRVLNRHSLQNISGLHEYIYNRTLVQCQNCKNWEGQFQQYKVHIRTCNTTKNTGRRDRHAPMTKIFVHVTVFIIFICVLYIYGSVCDFNVTDSSIAAVDNISTNVFEIEHGTVISTNNECINNFNI